MAHLTLPNIDDSVVEALRRRAARNGCSAEAEHREILREALLGENPLDLKQHLLAIPEVGEDADFEVPRPLARMIEL